MKRHALGIRTAQLNPSKPGALTLAQWLSAVLSMRGLSEAMQPKAAIELIHLTPETRRSSFAHQIWGIRRSRGTDRKYRDSD